MFGRRRHAAPVAVAPTPQLSGEQIFELVHAQLSAVIGEHGTWTMARRTDTDTDEIFHGVLAHSIALTITDALRDAQVRLATERPEASSHVAEHVAEPHPDLATPAAPAPDAPASGESAPDTSDVEPAAFRWDPAPITIWTDLKKPVTGELARIDGHELVA